MTEQASKERVARPRATAPDPTPEQEAERAQREQLAVTLEAHRSLSEAIAWVAGQTADVPKKGFNNHFGYSYATKDDIVNHLKPLLAQAGLAIIPRHIATSRSEPDDKGMVDLVVTWEMLIIHGPTGATMMVPWESESMDNQDKGFAKATTSAMKQFVQAIFDIPSGDLDVEHDAHSGQTRQGGDRQTARPSSRPSGGATTKQILDFKETHGLSNIQLGQAIEAAGGDPTSKVKDLPADLRATVLANLERVVEGGAVAAQEAMSAAPDDGPGPWVGGSGSDDDIPFAASFI